MSSGRTTFTQFGPDPPYAELPGGFAQCLPPAAPSAYCDGLVGSLQAGQGYCSTPAYAQTTYCSCVNNAIPCPMVASAACANSAYAYTPTDQTPPNGPHYLACKGQPICVNLVEVGGSQNIVSGITQQCGIITNVTNVVKANPTLAALAFVLLVALVLLLLARADSDGDGNGGDGSGSGSGAWPPRGVPPPPPWLAAGLLASSA